MPSGTDGKKPHFSLLRTFEPPDLVTLGNAASGVSAMLLAMRYAKLGDRTAIVVAMALLPLALLFDVLDGTLARRTGRASPLGADLDSLADVVSFGVAPAALGFALGLDTLMDGACLVVFVACGISRLARYNVTAGDLSGGTGKVPYYEGTPIPTSLSLVALLAYAFFTGRTGEAMWLGEVESIGLHPFALLYVLSGSLMASGTLRIPKP